MNEHSLQTLSPDQRPDSLKITIQDLGQTNYLDTWNAMNAFTESREETTPDEIWVCQHDPVFTLGLAGDPAHLLTATEIPLVKTDRGGQITYHGPGQIVIYPLLDLRRYGLKVREYVKLLEQGIIDVLVQAGLDDAQRKPDAPGVYIGWDLSNRCRKPVAQGGELAKVAALGIKIRKGCSYHGLSLNIRMDLNPFHLINPCGYQGLETLDLFSAGVKIPFSEMQLHLVKNLVAKLESARSASIGNISEQ